ncbi:unnamed protein product, partial [Prorocentrum cordatum]
GQGGRGAGRGPRPAQPRGPPPAAGGCPWPPPPSPRAAADGRGPPGQGPMLAAAAKGETAPTRFPTLALQQVAASLDVAGLGRCGAVARDWRLAITRRAEEKALRRQFGGEEGGWLARHSPRSRSQALRRLSRGARLGAGTAPAWRALPLQGPPSAWRESHTIVALPRQLSTGSGPGRCSDRWGWRGPVPRGALRSCGVSAF